MDGGEPDIPIYKMIECKGPTNTRVYTVAVYFRSVIMSVNCWHFYFNLVLFRGDRLAKAQGHSIQQAEMNAAKLALEKKSDLFPHLNYQKRIMEKSFKRQGVMSETIRETWYKETLRKRRELGLDAPDGTPIKQEVKVEVKQEQEDQAVNEIQGTSCGTVQDQPLQSEPEKETSVESHEVEKEKEGKSEERVIQVQDEVFEEISDPQPSNKEAVRAEIKEIEEKLKKKREEKAAKVAAAEADLEDGECIDSDEDEEEEAVSTPVCNASETNSKKIAPSTSQPPQTQTVDKAKQREDNRKRWGDERRDRESRDRDMMDGRDRHSRTYICKSRESRRSHEIDRDRKRSHERERDSKRSHERDRDRYYYDHYRS